MLDASGFVRRSQVFAGNVREHRTLAEMLDALDAPREALVVMDRGIATEECVKWLRENDYRYLVVSRERTRYFDPEAAQRIESAQRQGVHLHKVVSDDGQELRLHCFSEERANKERAIVERFATRFEQALTKLSEGLSRPRTEKRAGNIRERIGRLKAKSRGIAQHYHIDIDTDPTGERATAVRFTRQPVEGSMMTHPGVYCLRSNQTDWDEETLWRTYVTLTDIEAVFRSLKSELGLRPIFHHKPIRAEGHLFITVIAYQLVQVIRQRLRQGDPHGMRTLPAFHPSARSAMHESSASANVGIAAARLRSAIGSMPRWRLRTLSKAMSRASERLTTGQGPRPKLRRLPSMVRR